MITFNCSKCGKKFRAPEKNVGKKTKCTKCGNIIVVPAIESVDPEASLTSHYVSHNDQQLFSKILKFGSLVVVPLLILFFIYWFGIHNRWEKDHYQPIVQLKQKADLSFEQKNYEYAVEYYYQILDLVGDRKIALNSLVQLVSDAKIRVIELENLFFEKRNLPKLEALEKKADLSFEKGKFREAQDNYEYIVNFLRSADEETGKTNQLLSRVLDKSKDSSFRFEKKQIEEWSEGIAQQFEEANNAFKSGSFKTAISIYKTILDSSPKVKVATRELDKVTLVIRSLIEETTKVQLEIEKQERIAEAKRKEAEEKRIARRKQFREESHSNPGKSFSFFVESFYTELVLIGAQNDWVFNNLYSYDLEKTNSLVNPYIGYVKSLVGRPDWEAGDEIRFWFTIKNDQWFLKDVEWRTFDRWFECPVSIKVCAQMAVDRFYD